MSITHHLKHLYNSVHYLRHAHHPLAQTPAQFSTLTQTCQSPTSLNTCTIQYTNKTMIRKCYFIFKTVSQKAYGTQISIFPVKAISVITCLHLYIILRKMLMFYVLIVQKLFLITSYQMNVNIHYQTQKILFHANLLSKECENAQLFLINIAVLRLLISQSILLLCTN